MDLEGVVRKEVIYLKTSSGWPELHTSIAFNLFIVEVRRGMCYHPAPIPSIRKRPPFYSLVDPPAPDALET